jgi:cellulose synthase/poly-beta-1,6-N-acetylglucosamine synthase-like glycosyltransferase
MQFVTPELFLAPLSWIYGASIILLTIAGINSLVNSILYLSSRKRITHSRLQNDRRLWPRVTVQLPLYNERYMVARLLQAVTQMDYPLERMQIQVLDDSTDDTTLLAKHQVAFYQALGYDITLIHRSDRSGYKAGALENGMNFTNGDLIAIFDADFLPPSDWLKRVVVEFDDPRIGFVQTRWGYTNSDYNLLTNLQALALNQQFVVEHNARLHNGLFMSFNGSGGMWRDACIRDSGGWQSDTLVEDLDLSFRAQLRGWKPGYLPDVVVPNDLPVDIEAFKRQQYRWAKGGAQTLVKLGRRLLRSKLPLHVRAMGFIQLSLYLTFPLMLVLLLTTLPLALMGSAVFALFPWTIIGAVGLPLAYALTRTEYHPSFIRRILLIPGVLLMGFGLVVNNSAAVLEGLFRRGGEFVRTPKPTLNSIGSAKPDAYSVKFSPLVWGELCVALYTSLCMILLWNQPVGIGLLPWLSYYSAAFLFSGFGSLLANLRSMRRPAPRHIPLHIGLPGHKQ